MGPAQKPLLIIFYRNPKLGEVKTRLAVRTGNEKALEIFKRLALHTRTITTPLSVEKIVYYSDFIDVNDMWPLSTYRKSIQKGGDLGERMKNAFISGFDMNYGPICIIGTDCYELETAIIEKAFRSLQSTDAVIGPARDGGYYLLGMARLYTRLFSNKQWSTETVYSETVGDFESLGLKYSKLVTLRDVDTVDDLPAVWNDLL